MSTAKFELVKPYKPSSSYAYHLENCEDRVATYGKGYDYYDVLGVDDTASDEDICDAYKRNVMRWHPDEVSTENQNEQNNAVKVWQNS